MVKFILNIGFVQFIRGYFRRKKFIKALAKCDSINAVNRGTAIVVSCGGDPMILTKRDYKRLVRNGTLHAGVSWGAMSSRQVTHKSLLLKSTRNVNN